MIIFLIEALCIIILAITLSTLIWDEKLAHRRNMELVKLRGFWDGDERRSTDRLNISLEVHYKTTGRQVSSKSTDISEKGIRLVLDRRFETGTPLTMAIRIPDRDHIVKTTGSVVWVIKNVDRKNPFKRLFNTGIKFHKFHDSGEEKLFSFLQNFAKNDG